MANEDKKDVKTGVSNPKQGANSGVSKPSSTDGDTGPKTTQSDYKGRSVVDDRGRVR